MKTKTLILILHCSLSISLYSQVNWKMDTVVISGKVIHFEDHKDKNAIQFYFREIFTNENQSTHVAEIDSLGKFNIQVPLYFPQDLYIDYGGLKRLWLTPVYNRV